MNIQLGMSRTFSSQEDVQKFLIENGYSPQNDKDCYSDIWEKTSKLNEGWQSKFIIVTFTMISEKSWNLILSLKEKRNNSGTLPKSQMQYCVYDLEFL